MTIALAAPTPSEYAPYYHRYVERVPASELAALLDGQPGQLRRMTGSLDDAGALARYAEGKWSVKEVIGHIIDVERVMSYRLLRIARGDRTPLPGFDQDPYVARAGFDPRPLETLLAEFEAVRTATGALVAGLSEPDWDEAGTASELPVSARGLLYIIVGHAAHHFAVLRERYGLAA